jgi:hypothetical protein
MPSVTTLDNRSYVYLGERRSGHEFNLRSA